VSIQPPDAEEARLWQAKEAAGRRFGALAADRDCLKAQLEAMGRPDDAALPRWTELARRLDRLEEALLSARDAEREAVVRWCSHWLRSHRVPSSHETARAN
jgi:hypothetical protein